MEKWIFLFLIIVVTDPYEGIDYNEINVYEITEKCNENCINYHPSEYLEQVESVEIEIEELIHVPQSQSNY